MDSADRSLVPFSSPSPGDWTRLSPRLREEWEAFQITGETPRSGIVRPTILSRWLAARDSRVDPALHHVPLLETAEELQERLANDDFVLAGRRVLDDMREVVSENLHTLLLTDARGCVVYVTGEPEVTEAISDLNCRTGGFWDEDVAGPNGMGTALRTGSPAIVYGAEHFCERWQNWVCYGAPVHDPSNERVLGVVNLTGWASRVRVNQMPLTMSLARSIEYLLAPLRGASRRALRDAWEELRRRFPSDAVFLCDDAGRASGVDPETAERLERSGVRFAELARHPRLRALAEPGATHAETEIVLSNGVHVVARAVRPRGRYAGSVLVVRSPCARERRESGIPAALAALVGEAPAFREALRLASRAARSRESVLVTGESGTGKELVARAIHALGPRACKPLVAVNCAALPRELAESELFGYERGAFTGADRAGKRGRFDLANGGTLFLDEIGELPLELQGKLLRVLDERMVFPLGASRPRAVDVRILAATNRDLSRAVAEGTFRLDLYHRLSVLEIALPPLRDRGEDVVRLARRFLEESCAEEGRAVPALGPAVETALRAYPWPGNVRELRNVAIHLALWTEGSEVLPSDLPPRVRVPLLDPPAAAGSSLRAIERDLFERTVAACGGNRSEAARRLGVDRSTVYRHLKRFGRS